MIRLILLFILASCTKEDALPAPEPCLAVTNQIKVFDASGKVVQDFTAIHWHNVCREELARFVGKVPDTLCWTPVMVSYYHVGIDSCSIIDF